MTGQGFSAHLTLYPKQRRAIVILSNGETTPNEQIGLLGMSLLLIAVSVHYRRRRQPT